jgi:CRP/FNR family transcriptional regulator, cyclic AMP receptor protein
MSRRRPLVDQLARVPLFGDLLGADLGAVAERVVRMKEPAGVVFTKEGERGHEFLIVLDGTVTVARGGRVVATLGPGDWFGELALLDEGARRTATVVAETRVDVGFLSRQDFDGLLRDLPAVASQIRATAATRRAELGHEPTERDPAP